MVFLHVGKGVEGSIVFEAWFLSKELREVGSGTGTGGLV